MQENQNSNYTITPTRQNKQLGFKGALHPFQHISLFKVDHICSRDVKEF